SITGPSCYSSDAGRTSSGLGRILARLFAQVFPATHDCGASLVPGRVFGTSDALLIPRLAQARLRLREGRAAVLRELVEREIVGGLVIAPLLAGTVVPGGGLPAQQVCAVVLDIRRARQRPTGPCTDHAACDRANRHADRAAGRTDRRTGDCACHRRRTSAQCLRI